MFKGREGGGGGHKKPASLTFGKFNFIGKESPRTPLLYYAPKDNSIPLKRKKAFKHTKSNVSLGKKITNSVSHFSFSFLLFFWGGGGFSINLGYRAGWEGAKQYF